MKIKLGILCGFLINGLALAASDFTRSPEVQYQIVVSEPVLANILIRSTAFQESGPMWVNEGVGAPCEGTRKFWRGRDAFLYCATTTRCGEKAPRCTLSFFNVRGLTAKDYFRVSSNDALKDAPPLQ